MYRFAIIILISTSLVLISGCKKKTLPKVLNEPQKESVKPAIKKIEFVIPADSLITTSQMKSWIACNPLLDSIAIMYVDSFKTDDAQKRLRYQADFSSAQDKICVISGLPGGYKEYRWIMDNIGNTKNKDVVENSNASVF
jgi:hypothetical protein